MSNREELILLRGRGRISALGTNGQGDAAASPGFTMRQQGPAALPVAALPQETEKQLVALSQQHAAYRQLDRTVLLAILAARQASAQAGWASHPEAALAVSIGSSRGATGRLEHHHHEFLTTGTTAVAASPLTTLGNVASWVAYDAGLRFSGVLRVGDLAVKALVVEPVDEGHRREPDIVGVCPRHGRAPHRARGPVSAS